MTRFPHLRWLPFALLLAVAGCVSSGETAVVTERPTPPSETATETGPTPAAVAVRDTVRAGRFDQGKMWTFDNPPVEYFQEEYGFAPDEAWFSRARLGALRFADYCSASFVSSSGLVMTNHHCGRESISAVSREGEDLLDNGFYATSTADEREVEDLFVEQLIRIEDVTEDVYRGRGGEGPLAERRSAETEQDAERRRQRAEALGERLTREAQARDSSLQVEVVSLFSGGRYSAYTFRRYDDVRLVMAPELQLGFYGGSPDNFTYPRYALDVAFFRAYNDEGQPVRSTSYFPWSLDGAEEGEAVFVVGNPGSTNRLSTVAQLEFQRDYALPQQLEALRSRAAILEDYVRAHPDSAEAYDLRNLFFSLENSVKSTEGELDGLRDDVLIARRRAAEEALQDSIAASDSLREAYGRVVGELQRLQRSKEVSARQSAAFTFFTSPTLGSRILTRATYGYFYDQIRRRPGVSPEQLQEIREEALKIEDWPRAVEEQFITARLRDLQEYLGATDPTVRRILQGRAPQAIAQNLAQNSALADSAGFAQLLDEGYLASDDPSVEIIRPLASLFLELNRQTRDFASTEEGLGAQLALARFAVQGQGAPPDASFSLRLADGRVMGYEYNGTRAPAFTNFYGLYDHYYAYRPGDYEDEPWALPEKWLTPPDEFDEATPLNLVSTNDITGGNSGSPLLNQDLEVVGLVFDSNIEALPNVFLYTYDTARAVSVDARGILEALDDIYDADRIVEELATGRLVPSEAALDEEEPAGGG